MSLNTKFLQLKQKQSSNLNSLAKKIEEEEKGSFQEDPRFWKLDVDKAGNGMAVIRFLPACDGEDLPWVKYFDHAFQGPGGWYIDNCATSINKECAICAANSELWNSGVESNKDVARKRKRRKKYIANIYVVKDPAHPENDGQVKLFRFGTKIFEKIQECIKPKFDDEDPIDPFDLWTGANFKLKQYKNEGYPNYDRSSFDKPSPLLNDDEEMEKVWMSQWPLMAFLDDIEKTYNYDKQKARMQRVLSETKASAKVSTEAPKSSHVAKLMAAAESDSSESDDLDMEYFKKLAEE